MEQHEYIPVFKWAHPRRPSEHVKRVTKGFFGIEVEGDLWWYRQRRVWGCSDFVSIDRRCSTHAECRSFKALKRHLRKHYTTLVGREVTVVIPTWGICITVTWKKNN